MPASFPRSFAAILDMIDNVALSAPVARKVARKAGLKAGGGEPVGTRTIIDAYVHPEEPPLARQYQADFSNKTELRLSSRSDNLIYVIYSVSDPGPLDPGIWFDLTSASASDTPAWVDIPAEAQTQVRLALSTYAFGPLLGSGVSAGPFSVGLQAR